MARHLLAARIGLPTAGLVALVIGIQLESVAGPPDEGDGDGIPDAVDNCTLVSNGPPVDCDADQDGYGNHCDSDFNEDGAVDGVDFGIFKNAFKTSTDTGNGTDQNCDTAVDGVDFNIFNSAFKTNKIGPSGLACADPSDPGGCPN